MQLVILADIYNPVYVRAEGDKEYLGRTWTDRIPVLNRSLSRYQTAGERPSPLSQQGKEKTCVGTI